LGGSWALELAWHPAETNLRCAGISGICMPNATIVALIVSEISAFIRTDGQTDMARSTRLVILIGNIYTLWGRKRFLLPVIYFPTNLVYPFTIRVKIALSSLCSIRKLQTSFNRIFAAMITGARYPNGSSKRATVDSIERLVNIGPRQN